jgi:hypothetical protein
MSQSATSTEMLIKKKITRFERCHKTEIGAMWQQVTALELLLFISHLTVLEAHLLQHVTLYKP